MARAVVTGGAGFLGSHLCEALLDRDIEVVCLDNFPTGTPDNVAHLLEDPRFRLIRADVTDYVHVPQPVDHVLHFASPASPVDYAELPIHTLKVGSIGTLHSLGLAKEKGARFLLASTSETYGDPLVHPQPDISLARRALGWEPAVALDEGLQRTIDWFSQHEELGDELLTAGTPSPGSP
jgi:dTDP-glucose 4,6-dehydratase